MAKGDGDVREMRREAAERFLDGGEQLDMFGSGGSVVPAGDRRGPGRPAGASNKLTSKVREFMAHQGYRDPAEQLAMMAGLDRPDLHPMAYAGQIAELLGEDMADVLKVMRQAAADVMPYWHAKLTPDVRVDAPVMNVLMAAPGASAEQVRRVVGPPPMPEAKGTQDQGVSQSDDGDNDGEGRTE